MSETDSFFREVTEEVRQDRMFRLWKKYGPYGIAAVMVIVGVAALLTWMAHREVLKAREVGGAFLNSDITSVEDQETLLGSVEGQPAQIAKMRLAAARAEAGDGSGAAALYNEVADTSGLPEAYTQLARLEAVRVRASEIEVGEAEAALAPVVSAEGPYRLLALELRAMIRLNSGDTDGAHADLLEIIGAPEATRSGRERAIVLLASSGGELPEPAQQ